MKILELKVQKLKWIKKEGSDLSLQKTELVNFEMYQYRWSNLKKKIKSTEQNHRELWDTNIHTNIQVSGNPRKWKRLKIFE